jgi:uncharacterized membrane protein
MKSVFFRGYAGWSMRSSVALLALLACFVLVPTGGAAAPDGAAQMAVPQQEEPTGPDTTMVVRLESDGDARWNVTMRFALSEEDDAFGAVERAFENGSEDVGPSVTTFEALAARGSEAAGREMAISDVERRGWRPSADTGALTLTFTWSNFAAAEGERLVVGDAFGEPWDIATGQHLAVYPPEGYLPQSFQPGTDNGVSNGVLRWEGPRSFASDQPAIEYSGGDGGNGTAGPGPGPDDGVGAVVLAAVAAVLALAVGVAYLLYARRDDGADTDATTGPGPSPPGPATTPDGDDGGTAEPDPEAEGEGGEVDETLLSDEERVERLLERNGGRMKQANIVSETGWSNAKVSQLLSTMAEEGRVEKLRIGRENLISLPGEGEEE